MSTDLSILTLIQEASLVVQLVIALLILASMLSWTLIIIKSGQLRKARQAAERFEENFWSGISLNALSDGLTQKKARTGLERVFYDGFAAYKRLENTRHKETQLSTPQRAMRVAASKEIDSLEQNLSFLATVGSTSPYVGLFGTVWGIMNSFLSLGQMQQATLDVVAPGIAEALIATAIGLFAAIPAVIAYNRFNDQVDRLVVGYDNFRDEFTALLERHTLSTASNAPTAES